MKINKVTAMITSRFLTNSTQPLTTCSFLAFFVPFPSWNLENGWENAMNTSRNIMKGNVADIWKLLHKSAFVHAWYKYHKNCHLWQSGNGSKKSKEGTLWILFRIPKMFWWLSKLFQKACKGRKPSSHSWRFSVM